MKRFAVLIVAVLFGGLMASSVFAQDIMSLSPGGFGQDAMSSELDPNCLADVDFSGLGIAEDAVYASVVNLLYGFDVGGGAGLGDGSGAAQVCWLHTFSDACGSCTLSWGGEGERYWTELWCLGIMIFRSKAQCLWCP